MSSTAPSPETHFLTADPCSDVIWHYDEEQTYANMAGLTAAALDAMRRSDGWDEASRVRHSPGVGLELVAFARRFPGRKPEMLQRIREGRLAINPFLTNSVWGVQSVEGFLRTMMEARRIASDAGASVRVAMHSEAPTLPLGVVPLLAGCGVEWLVVPWLDFDTAWKSGLPDGVFDWIAPDGSRVRVATQGPNYWAARSVVENLPGAVDRPATEPRGAAAIAPNGAVLRSGLYSDLTRNSAAEVADFAERIRAYNAGPRAALLVNATLDQYAEAVDASHAQAPWIPERRGCFGQSWECWVLSLARSFARWREGERDLLAAEALLAAGGTSGLAAETQRELDEAEHMVALLSDHSWNDNGAGGWNLRAPWCERLERANARLLHAAWARAGLDPAGDGVAVFNAAAFPRAGLVRLPREAPAPRALRWNGAELPVQTAASGREWFCHVPEIAAGAGVSLRRVPQPIPAPTVSGWPSAFEVSAREIRGAYYRVRADDSGGVAALEHGPSGAELRALGREALGLPLLFDGRFEHRPAGVDVRVVDDGPLFATLRIAGMLAGVHSFETDVTIFAHEDRVDFECRFTRHPAVPVLRLCHRFALGQPGSALRLEAGGVVLDPRPLAMGGHLRPENAHWRQPLTGFAHVMGGAAHATLLPLDSFCLRPDLPWLTIEALGHDHNTREVRDDQGGETAFRFRYVLRGGAGAGPALPEVFRFARQAWAPLRAARGDWARPAAGGVSVDPARAVVTAVKPADPRLGAGTIVRLWEVAGASGALELRAPCARAVACDLLERDAAPLEAQGGVVRVPVRAHGFASVRLLDA